MIKQLILRNFKSIKEQIYDFTDFDLLVGRNNCGKSTVLQALAIWQFCIDEFHRSDRKGSKGIQVVLPNFTALPIPEFNLLWKDKTDRSYPMDEQGKKVQQYILIEIVIKWKNRAEDEKEFGVQLRYQSPQAIFAIPMQGWSIFRRYEQENCLPKIAYVPPFSGLEPTEKRLDNSPIRQQVGKGQPGSVLRNLLWRVNNPLERDKTESQSQSQQLSDYWAEFASVVDRWFGVKILPPQYNADRDVNILVEYQQNSDKKYDIIAGGSGFHQTLTLLAFLYGYQPTTILLDEPDAHLHVNLQREILDYFKRKSGELNIQFLVATHSEEFVRGVDTSQIVSLLAKQPQRIQSTPEIVRAMADVTNEEIVRLLASPYIVYIEGESDERILRAWTTACNVEIAMDKVCFKLMGGGGKENMKTRADEHFSALQKIIPEIKRLMLFDYDSGDEAFHPESNNPTLAEWKRKNIENYLLVPDVWKRAIFREMRCEENDLFALPVIKIIDDFFTGENLTLPNGKAWNNLSANIFSLVDGKRLLFENKESLFSQLRNYDSSLILQREKIAGAMTTDEIHQDVHQFMEKLRRMTAN